MTTTRYDYNDENGRILYSKVRIQDENGKNFYWERKENGTIIKNLEGCRKILYRLPEVLYGIRKNIPIYLVEGEKDAHTLLNCTLIATTSPGSLEWFEEFTEILKEADVVILYDYDKTGFQRRDMLCKALHGKIKRLRVVDLLGLEYREKHGQDITDWFEMGNTIEQFLALVESTPDYTLSIKEEPLHQSSLRTVSVSELLALDLPPREMVLAPFLPTQGLAMIVAKRGVGKTHIALGIAYAIATGSTFLTWSAPRQRKVLYFDGEMPLVLMQERLNMIISMNDKNPEHFLQILTPDLQTAAFPDLSLKEGREKIDALVSDANVIILDNISCLFRSGSENEAESWQEVQEWILDLRRRGKSVILIHHAGKSGLQRGTSKREDILDTVIILKHTEDYNPEEGARFEIIFDKARHFSGEDARSFQAHLKTNGTTWCWELSAAPEEAEISKIATMKNNGYTIKQISEQTKLTKAQVEYRIAKAREKDLIIKE